MRPGPSPFARPDCKNHVVSECPKGQNPGRTYRFYTGKSVIPFGFGMSYTSFKYAMVKQPSTVSLDALVNLISQTNAAGHRFVRSQHVQDTSQETNWEASVQYAVNVTNTGNRDSDDVVLGF